MYQQFRIKVPSELESFRDDFIAAFTAPHGIWSSVKEYGDRNGAEDPCIMIQNADTTIHGLLPYQAAYWLCYGEVPPKGKCISHRCRNQKNRKSTKCCTPSHMLIRDQKDNNSRHHCHVAITQKANSKKQSQSDPLIGAITIDECKHKGADGKECCLISYGFNDNATDSVLKYVLSVVVL